MESLRIRVSDTTNEALEYDINLSERMVQYVQETSNRIRQSEIKFYEAAIDQLKSQIKLTDSDPSSTEVLGDNNQN